jgi:hypothetical protein
MTYTHPDLDGTYNRLLGESILQSIDPNDGQSPDPADKTRHQYTLASGILLTRRLPPESVGDLWIEPATGKHSRRPPAFESIDIPAHWRLLVQWMEHVYGDTPRPWSMGGSAAYAGRIPIDPCDDRGMLVRHGWDDDGNRLYEPVRMVWMRSRIELTGCDWPQQVACPHCHDWIVWAEACYAPGRRICRGCHRHWQITLDSSAASGWVLRRCNYPRIWPYGDAR